MSLEIKNILVAKELTKESAQVIRYALELGCKFHAQVHVLHVMPTVDPAVLNYVALSMGADKLAKLNAENESALAKQTREQLHAMILEEAELMEEELIHPPKVEVHHGEPAPMILSVADRVDADMIVLGSHNKGKLHYAFLGSVSRKILDKSHRTVVMVPPQVEH
ncbi:MAG TPA: universal stress protein [Malonomonas sp.]